MATEQCQYELSESIREIASGFPDFDEGSSCVNRAFKAGGKNFLFLGEKPNECNIRLKLDASVPDIETRAKTEPDAWQIGQHGWCFFRFDPTDLPAPQDLQRWITESFFLLAPKKVSKLYETMHTD